jgi:hypothetical protein
MNEPSSESENLAGGDARYILDSSAILRASFGNGSTLETYPGFTRRLTPTQMDAIWLITQNLLEHNDQNTRLHAGQPQSMVEAQIGSVVEIHMNADDQVFVFSQSNQQAAALVDALAALAWVDTAAQQHP